MSRRRRNQEDFEEGDRFTLLLREQGENRLVEFEVLAPEPGYRGVRAARVDELDQEGDVWDEDWPTWHPDDLRRGIARAKDFQKRGPEALAARVVVDFDDLVTEMGVEDMDTYVDQVNEWAAFEAYPYYLQAARDGLDREEYDSEEAFESAAEAWAQEKEGELIDAHYQAYLGAVESAVNSTLRDAGVELSTEPVLDEDCPGCLGLEVGAECPVHGTICKQWVLETDDILASLEELEPYTDVNDLIDEHETPAEALAHYWASGVDSSAKRQFEAELDSQTRNLNPGKKTMATKKKRKKTRKGKKNAGMLPEEYWERERRARAGKAYRAGEAREEFRRGLGSPAAVARAEAGERAQEELEAIQAKLEEEARKKRPPGRRRIIANNPATRKLKNKLLQDNF